VIIVLGLFFGCGSGGESNNIVNNGNDGNSTGCMQASIAGLTLKWDPPATNEDGSPLTNLEGYHIYYGTASDHLIESVNAGPSTSYTITPSGPGTWYFAVTAYTSSGITESEHSNIVCADIF